MERNIILNFIADNFNTLKDIDFTKMTICLYGLDIKNHPLEQLIDKELLFTYNVNLPRIFKKTYSLDKMNEAILKYSNNIDTIKTLSKDDLMYESYKDPYSDKNLFEIDFEYVSIIPIIINDYHVGAILIYSFDRLDNLNITTSSINTLYNSLILDEVKQLESDITSILGKNYNGKFIIEKNQKQLLIEGVNDFILSSENCFKFLTNPSIQKTSFSSYNLYYLKEEETNNNIIYDASSINDVKKNNEFSLICFSYLNSSIDILKFIKKLNIDCSFNTFIDKGFYTIVINKIIGRPVYKQMFEDYNEYSIYISSKELSTNLDLYKLITYLRKDLPISFSFKSYNEYLRKINEELLFINKIDDHKTIVNSLTQEQTLLLNDIIVSDFIEENISSIEKKTLKVLKSNAYHKSYVISMPSTLLNKKNLKDFYKNELNDSKVTYIIHYDSLTNKQDFYTGLINAKTLGIKIIVDSSIFFNLKTLDLSMFIDGIYIKKDELVNIKTSGSNIFYKILEYYLENKKEIILEDNSSLKKSDIYISYVK